MSQPRVIANLAPGKWLVLACVILLQGCAIRWVVIHDGLNTTVVDAATKAPIPDALVLAVRYTQAQGVILARSDSQGRLHVEPKRKLELMPLMGEAQIYLGLTVCKEGYVRKEIQTRGGWNSDFAPAQTLEIEFVELAQAKSASTSGCAVKQ